MLTFAPLILLKNRGSRIWVLHGKTRHGQPITPEKKEAILKAVKHRNRFLKVLLVVPLVLFWGTIIASLERTPLTGRSAYFHPVDSLDDQILIFLLVLFSIIGGG